MGLATGEAKTQCLEEKKESYLLLRKLCLSHATPFIWTSIPNCLNHSRLFPDFLYTTVDNCPAQETSTCSGKEHPKI